MAEAPAATPDVKKESVQGVEDLRSSFDKEFVNSVFGVAEEVTKEGGNKNALRDLLVKYKPLLESDIEAYQTAIGYFGLARYDPAYLDQLIDIGKAHLATENARKFVRSTLEGIGASKDFKGGVLKDLARKGFQKTLDFLKKKMAEDPVVLVGTLSRTAEHFPELVPQIDRSSLKGKIVNDADFYILTKTATLPGYDPEVAVSTASEILLNSQERPFENLPKFVDIARVVLDRYKTHQNAPLIELVLRRGAHFIKEDAQTAEQIQKMIAESGYEKK